MKRGSVKTKSDLRRHGRKRRRKRSEEGRGRGEEKEEKNGEVG